MPDIAMPDESGIRSAWLTGLRTACEPFDLGSLGRFRILSEANRGGQGIVYEAIQEGLERKVALKRLLMGRLASERERWRFQQEAMAAGSLCHPSIVTIHDIGEFDGQLLIVMEWIEGLPIHEYASQQNLGIESTVDLFLSVCEAIQYAHTRGVIHRDIKPHNILIRDDKTPCVIDFGLASVGDVGASRIKTVAGEFLGTAVYASPERRTGTGESRDIRSDVYSLGVVLYELLAGNTPYTTDQNVEAQFNSMNRRQAKPPSSHNRGIPYELDLVVLKALQADAGDRYQTVSSLTEDLIRWRSGLPVLAHPPNSVYQAIKFLRRHKRSSILAAMTAATLVLLTALSLFFALGEHRERVRAASAEQSALEKAKVAEDIEEFAVSVLSLAKPEELGGTATIMQAIDYASRILDESKDPTVHARLHHTLGDIYTEFHQFEEARKHLSESIRLYQEHSQNANSGLNEFEARTLLAAIGRHNDPTTAASKLRVLAHEAEERFGANHDVTLSALIELGNALRDSGDTSGALALLEDLQSRCTAILGASHDKTLTVLNNLATVANQSGDHARALELHETGYRLRKITLPRSHPMIATSALNLASSYLSSSMPDRAEPLLHEALAIREHVLGQGHERTLRVMTSLGNVQYTLGKFSESKQTLTRCHEISRDHFGERDPRTQKALNRLGLNAYYSGDFESAATTHETCLRLRVAELGEDHPSAATSRNNLALAYTKLEKHEQAIELLTHSIDGFIHRFGSNANRTLSARSNLALAYAAAGNIDKSLSIHADVIERRTAHFGPDHPRTAVARLQHGTTLERAGVYQNARDELQAILPTIQEHYGDTATMTISCTVILGRALNHLGLHDEALTLLEPASARYDAAGGAPTRWQAGMLHSLGVALLDSGDFRQAAEAWGARDAVIAHLPVSVQEILFDKYDALDSLYAKWAEREAPLMGWRQPLYGLRSTQRFNTVFQW